MSRSPGFHRWPALVTLAGVSAVLAWPAGATTTPATFHDGELSRRTNETLGLEASSIVSIALDGQPDGQVMAVVPIDGLPSVLLMEPHSVRADGYQLLVQVEDGSLVPVDPGPERTLRGTVLGIEGSVVAGSLLEDGLHARIMMPDGGDVWLEPIAGRVAGAAPGQYAVYHGDDAIGNGTCAADQIEQPNLPLGESQPLPGGAAGGGISVAELACDADFEYFQDHGGDVQLVQDDITNVINTMDAQYVAVGITHDITVIVVRSSSNDPYTKKPADQLLNQFRSEWESSAYDQYQRDVAQLFTGRTLAGSTIGIAWLGAVCTSYGYSVVQSDFNGNLACATDLSAHELGHNWGADHCSCAGNPPFTMNSYITCANAFSPDQTIPEIIAFRDTRTCLGGGGGGGPTCGDTVCEPGEDPCCPECQDPVEICNDGIDNDCDGLVDCADPDCISDPGCSGGGGDLAIVDCITYTTQGGPANNPKHLVVTVTIVDDTDNAVAGASVSMTLTSDSGGSYNFGGTTDENGNVAFTLLQAANDVCYTSDVTSVSAPGLSFNGAEPPNGFNKNVDPTPDADCRSLNDPCGG